MQAMIFNLLKSAGRYAAANPRLLGEIARNALHGRLTVPLDLLRWAATLLPPGGSTPGDITVVAQPPALGLGATANLMGTQLRVDAALIIDALETSAEQFKVTLRVRDLRASVLNNLDGNLAKLLKSGVLNLSKPASLLNFVPKKPPAILEAKEDRFVIDLLKFPEVANNPAIRKALAALTPILAIGEIRTENDNLVIGLKAMPRGLRDSFAALRG
jgi:hypothetical protein